LPVGRHRRRAPAERARASVAKSQNIVQIAASNPQFSTLVSLVKKAGLVGALSGKTKLTVFAPTNAAFKKVPKATLNKLAKNRKLLAKVLEYHVLPGVRPGREARDADVRKNARGHSRPLQGQHGKAYVNNARIVKTDIHASNGIIHVINAVLLPPTS